MEMRFEKARFRGNPSSVRWRKQPMRIGATYELEIMEKLHWAIRILTLGLIEMTVKVETSRGYAYVGYRNQKEFKKDWKIIREE